MGQRTFILVKKTYQDKAVINLIHHQWGYGKVMPSLFLQELLRFCYPLNRSAYDKVHDTHRSNYEGTEKVEPIDIDFTFEPLNNKHNNYVADQVVDRDLDVFSIPVIKEYADMTDNNNGGMIVEVIQKYDSIGNPLTYGDMIDIKIGFVLGDEEVYYYNDFLNSTVPIEEEFGRLLSAKEYMTRTLSRVWKNDLSDSDKKFIGYFDGFCNWVGVEQVFDKKGAKEIKDRINTIHQTVKGLTQNLKQGQTIDVPRELMPKVQVFA